MANARGSNKREYDRIHKWLQRKATKKGQCSFCNTVGYTEWSNKSGLYKQLLIDYEELCRSCHKFYDYNVSGIKMGFCSMDKTKHLKASSTGGTNSKR